MNKKIGNIEIEKQKLWYHKNAILICDIDIDKIIGSNKISFSKKGFKYFIGYKDNKKLVPYVYCFQKSVHIDEILMKLNICFFIKDDEFLEKCNEILDKVNSNSQKVLDNESVYNQTYLKTKIKSYYGKVNINFRDDKVPKKVLIVLTYQ